MNPDEFYVHKPQLQQGRPAILRRNMGEKGVKMVYTGDQRPGHSTETVEVTPAERMRFSLDDNEVLALARQALIIEGHYQRPMDIEWGKDGTDGELYILQARPETVKSRTQHNIVQRYELKERGDVIITGRGIGQRIGAGKHG